MHLDGWLLDEGRGLTAVGWLCTACVLVLRAVIAWQELALLHGVAAFLQAFSSL